jgi:TetR/AcrR family transcriptional repressor of nem operon
MRYPPAHKEATRQRILDAAAVVFRRLGYQGAGVDAVMQEAGLTAGGFYAHFASKEALFAETLGHALSETRTLGSPGIDHLAGMEWLRKVAARYLSVAHRRQVDRGCPLPALLPEVARASQHSRQALEARLRQVAANIESHLPPTQDNMAQNRALAVLAVLVGGMTLARAVADESLSDRILAASRCFVEAGVAQSARGAKHKQSRNRQGRGAARNKK